MLINASFKILIEDIDEAIELIGIIRNE